MRVIIIAAGEAKRWNNYLGVNKHFIEIDGEPILKRTVRLLRERGVTDIYIVSDEEQYNLEGAKLYHPKRNPDNGDLDKFMNSRELWTAEPENKTFIFYGDVYFTEHAIDAILNDEREHFVMHCRPFGSSVTGTPWGECFAVSFNCGYHNDVDAAFVLVKDLYEREIMHKMGGWELYRATLHKLLPEKLMGQHWVTGININVIDDWTDDFDFPDDYDLFMKKRKEAGL